jgi:hypothetical protein
LDPSGTGAAQAWLSRSPYPRLRELLDADAHLVEVLLEKVPP